MLGRGYGALSQSPRPNSLPRLARDFGHSESGKEDELCFMCRWSSGYIEYRTRNFQVTGSNLTAGHLQATLSKLLTYGVLRSTQPPTHRGTGNEYSLRATG